MSTACKNLNVDKSEAPCPILFQPINPSESFFLLRCPNKHFLLLVSSSGKVGEGREARGGAWVGIVPAVLGGLYLNRHLPPRHYNEQPL